MKLICILCLTLSSLFVSAQKTESSASHAPIAEQDRVYDFVQVPPEFIGGDTAMLKYLTENLRYPEEARLKRISGDCVVRFVVTYEGKISNAKIIKGIGGGCDEEALRVIKEMPA